MYVKGSDKKPPKLMALSSNSSLTKAQPVDSINRLPFLFYFGFYIPLWECNMVIMCKILKNAIQPILFPFFYFLPPMCSFLSALTGYFLQLKQVAGANYCPGKTASDKM